MKLSLKLRLTLLFLLLSLTAWFAASLVAWQQTTHKLDKLFDTQQMLFAKRLLTMDLDEIRAPERMREVPKKAKHGHLDDDALAFAIFSADGSMILNDGENGHDIPYHYRRDGFADGRLQDDNDEWRFLWLTSPNGKYRVVVGQEWEYRQDMALAAYAVAGGAARHAAVADPAVEPRAEAAEKAGADPALPHSGCHR